MAAEMKEIDRELKVYNMHNASLENNISTIERKKAKILGLLNANRSRHNSVLRDVKKCEFLYFRLSIIILFSFSLSFARAQESNQGY